MEKWIEELKFDEKGLIPAVVQNRTTKEVLMVAYMNKDAAEQTVKTGKATFWSRSRNKLWVKGETSGNFMYVKDIRVDCDADCLLVEVDPAGAACHTGNRSCFYRKAESGVLVEDTGCDSVADAVAVEQATVIDRKNNPEDGSYTNYLFDKGEDKILKKVGEESTEVIIAGCGKDRGETVYEICDLIYHVLVLMVEMGISYDDILRELSIRHVVDHKIKQEKMK